MSGDIALCVPHLDGWFLAGHQIRLERQLLRARTTAEPVGQSFHALIDRMTSNGAVPPRNAAPEP